MAVGIKGEERTPFPSPPRTLAGEGQGEAAHQLPPLPVLTGEGRGEDPNPRPLGREAGVVF